MAPKNNTADGRAWGAGGWQAALSRPLWVVSAGAGIGLALGLTVWAGPAFAGGPGTAAPSALQGQVTALQQRLSKDESAINRLQALLGGVTRSRDGSALVITGNGAGTGSALKTVLFKGVNVQVVNGTGIETRLNGL